MLLDRFVIGSNLKFTWCLRIDLNVLRTRVIYLRKFCEVKLADEKDLIKVKISIKKILTQKYNQAIKVKKKPKYIIKIAKNYIYVLLCLLIRIIRNSTDVSRCYIKELSLPKQDSLYVT